jgi:CMP-N-acetylneuraminic acid synthetase
VDRVLISTDSAEMAAVARQAGAEAPFLRPAELATDTSSHQAVVEHALEWLRREGRMPDWILLLQPTSPLRTSQDITSAIALAQRDRPPAVISVREVEQHPWLCYRLDDGGRLEPLAAAAGGAPSSAAYLRRQDLPRVYALNGAIYLVQTEAFLRTGSLVPPGSHAYIMPAERSLDVDTPFDLRVADFLLTHAAAGDPTMAPTGAL